MKYYPKSQIKTGLYTKGNEFIISNNKESYKGYYWGTSTGEFYTGKTPDDKPSDRLLPLFSIDKDTLKVQQNASTQEEISDSFYIVDPSYYKAKNIPLNRPAPLFPKQFIPVPSQEDYANEYITRYFLKKNNEYKYMEISKADYLTYSNKIPTVPFELYTPISIKWFIVGDASFISNHSSIAQIENSMKWHGFSQYFKGKFDMFVK